MYKSWPSSATRFQTIPGMCNTCAAVGRDLQPLTPTSALIDICNGLALSPEDMVCFECIARLRGFSRFRRRALQVKAALWNIANNKDCWDEPSAIIIPCLSTLSKTELKLLELPELPESHLRQMPAVSPDDEVDSKGSLAGLVEKMSVPKVEMNMPWPELEVNLPWPEVEVNMAAPKVEMNMPVLMVNIPEPVIQVDMSEQKVEIEQDIESLDDTLASTEVLEDDVERKKAIVEPFCKEIHVDVDAVLKQMASVRESLQFKNAAYKCEQCACIFKVKRQFERHQRCHAASEGNFDCSVCHQRFLSLELMERHYKDHLIWYKCLHCELAVHSYDKLRTHHLHWHDRKPRKCLDCDKSFTIYKELKLHRRTHLPQQYACDVCCVSYKYLSRLERHKLMSHTNVAQLECEICHRKYKGSLNLEKHMRLKHNGQPKKAPDDNAYCAECDTQFTNISCYRNHLKTAKHSTLSDDRKRIECDHCGSKFDTKPGVLYHIALTHLRVKLYACSLCTESFYTPSRRSLHMRRSHGSKRPTYACEICNKIFKIKKSRREHMNIHLGVRPFQCKLCDAAFAYSAVLYNHNRLVHLKSKVDKNNTAT